VGSSESEECDQLLDTVLVGPVPRGTNKFEFRSNPPDATKIPQKDLIGVTVILLEGFYRDHMFIRVGYYVSNEYVGTLPAIMAKPAEDDGMDIEQSEGENDDEDDDEEDDDDVAVEEEGNNENKKHSTTNGKTKPPPPQQQPVLPANFSLSDIRRLILADKPRVTFLPVSWGGENEVGAPAQM
jgi:hypothetical protein